MSSSNLVRITAIEESTYGVTPGAGNFLQARVTSDSLSGTPETTESQQIRTDRLASGQVVTGLTVGGDISGELAKETIIDEFIESAMYSTFATSGAVVVDLTIVALAKTLDRASGDFNSDVVVGDVLILSGFAGSVNNRKVMVAEIVSATQIRYVGPDDMVDEVGSGTQFQVADKVDIGLTKKSFSMEKAFLDLTNKALIYRGQIANTMNVAVNYGDIVSYTFGFVGNDYENADQASEFITDGRTIDPPATSNSMNGSIDMSFIGLESGGIFDNTSFCIQSVEMSLNNNNTPQTCIGRVAPQDYSEGTAAIEIRMSAYLADDNWELLQKKITQQSFSLGFIIENAEGFYAFYMPAVQVSFDDPSIAGINQDVILSMSGTAKVGSSNEKSLTIYKG